jgi:uncharacterized membrane protein
MDTIFSVFLILHIAGGTVGLITGTINTIRRKGDKKHKLVGKVFTWAMLAAGGSALFLSSVHPNPFLFIVGVFTLYLVGTGNRYLRLKMVSGGVKPSVIDWILTGGMCVAALFFLYQGATLLSKQDLFGIVYIVFALIGYRFIKADLKNYKGNSEEQNFWLLAHIQRMIAGYISAMTAFLVVNGSYIPLPPVLLWLLPTAIFTPLIIKWSAKYRKLKKVDFDVEA